MNMESKPWLVPAAVQFLGTILRPDFVVFETGSGGSTLWLADRVSKVFSFEHDAEWFNEINKEIKKKNIQNVVLTLAPDYPKHGFSLKDMQFDFILVDGRGRVKTIKTIFSSLRSGGYLCLDNSERPRYQSAIDFLDASCSSKAIFKKDWQTTMWEKK
jgi:tRNA A58 N-methylase Trm61